MWNIKTKKNEQREQNSHRQDKYCTYWLLEGGGMGSKEIGERD